MAIKGLLRAKVVVGALLSLLFGSGIVVGLAWDHTANASTVEVARGKEPESKSKRKGGRIVDAVGLSVDQDASVDSIVAFHRQRMRDLDAEFRPRYRSVIEDLRQEIKGVLNDEQRAQYDVLLKQHDAERHSDRSRNSND